MEDSRPSPSSVVAAYAQSFVEGRKVVVFGDCTSGLAEILVERGARLVHVYDTDVSRVAEATARSSSSEIAFAPLGQSGVAVRDGAFDVGIVENLAVAEDPAALMTRVRRALAARGVAFVSCPNLEVRPTLLADAVNVESGPSYYELYDIVSREFDEVRMVGQTPFVGYALADFTPGVDEEFSIDTGFVQGGAEEPEWYLAVASHFPVSVEPFNVVQLPAAEVLEAIGGEQDHDAQERVAQLTRELDELRQRVAKDEARELLLETKRELEKRDAWALELEGSAAAADERADDAEARADEAEARVEQAEGQAHTAESRAQKADARAQKAEAQVQAVEARAQKAEALAQAAEARAQKAEARAQKAEAGAAEAEARLEAGEQRSESRVRAAEERAAPRVSEAKPPREPTLEAERIRELEVRLKETQRRLAEAEARLADAAEELRAQEQPSGRERELAALEDKFGRTREKLERAEQQRREEQDRAKALTHDLEAIERQLQDRGHVVVRLERELAETERLAAELLAERESERASAAEIDDTGTNGQQSAVSGSELAELQANLERLAQVDARRVADLTAAQWTVQELENRLADQQAEARGDIERLRAELQQQATLLTQVGKSPSA